MWRIFNWLFGRSEAVLSGGESWPNCLPVFLETQSLENAVQQSSRQQAGPKHVVKPQEIEKDKPTMKNLRHLRMGLQE